MPTEPSSFAGPRQTLTVGALSVRIFHQQSDLAHDAAAAAQKYLAELLAQKRSVRAILATGNSQLKFLETLAELPGIDWSRITLFHMDEYLGLSANHPASFRHYMKERVEKLVKPKQFHYLAGDVLQPIDECDRYTQLLQTEPIDLCCLGIGENGHIAFNDPPVADFEDPRVVKIVKLDEGCRLQQVGEGHFPSLDSVPQYALTLTIPTLCSARRMICIAPETRKAQAVKDALQGPISTACPASFLRHQSHCTLYLDQESASLL